ncbi:oxidoreductase [Burkholderia ubonensis]|uniref:oxidoreductase n=1 Tax=Burkholderia ubonensis TaxID=101571 RepID=UPI00075D1CA4|nr:oxidoreductase [Burkholderia ubonensis]KWK13794.1 oxidoreductase [Burkholderia ubonensis]KWK55889.1 oxidoreductase [Burkholderia ubonensis]
MSSLLRIGLMGFGFAGATFHAPVIAASGRTQVAAIATGQPDRARAAYPDARLVADLDALLALDDIECVVIATPNDTHFPLARQVLDAGRHVVVDKPVTLTSDEALALARLANARSRVFAPFHNRRWDGDFLTVRRIVESGELGRITYVTSHFDRFRPLVRVRWREEAARGGGLLLDLGPHLIDQALALFGLPDTVSATVKTRRDNGSAPDFVHVQLGYPDKDVALHASALSAIEPARFTLHGTRGSYQKFGLDTQEDQLKAGLTPDDVEFGGGNPPGVLRVLDGDVETERPVPTLDGQYAEFYRALAASIREGAPFPVTPQDAVDVMTIIELAAQSEHEGRRLPFVRKIV